MLSKHYAMVWRIAILTTLLFAIQTPAMAKTSSDDARSDSVGTWLPDHQVSPVTEGMVPIVTVKPDTARVNNRPDSVKTDAVKKWVTEHEEREQREVVLRYQYFTDDGMNEAYQQGFGVLINYVSFSHTTTRYAGQDHGIPWSLAGRGETGLIIGSGTPLRTSSKFEVKKSDLHMIALPLGFTIFHGLEESRDQSFDAYFGWGLGGFLGFERISCFVTRPVVGDEYEWHDTSYRHSFSGHALIGAQWNTNSLFSTVFELRWTQGGKGRLKRRPLSDEEIAQGWGEVFEEFQHSDFNFTGVTADVGIRW